jgi:hypothetical protein
MKTQGPHLEYNIKPKIKEQTWRTQVQNQTKLLVTYSWSAELMILIFFSKLKWPSSLSAGSLAVHRVAKPAWALSPSRHARASIIQASRFLYFILAHLSYLESALMVMDDNTSSHQHCQPLETLHQSWSSPIQGKVGTTSATPAL